MNTLIELAITLITPLINFLLGNPLYILILFVFFFLFLPMLKIVLGKK